MYNYGARYYDPSLSLWLCVNTLADHPNQTDKSPYAYTWNNHVNLTDHYGNCPWCVPAAFIGALGGFSYVLITGKSWEDTLAFTAGGANSGLTMGYGASLVAGAGGINTIGCAAVGFVGIGSCVIAGGAENATKQGSLLALGAQDGWNGEEFVINGVFGMAEGPLGIISEGIGNYLTESIKHGASVSISSYTKREFHNLTVKIARQLIDQSGGEISKAQSREAAKQIILTGDAAEKSVFQGSVKITEKSVELITPGLKSTVNNHIKSELTNGSQ